MEERKINLEYILLRSSGILLLLLLWEGAPRLGWVDAKALPPFSGVVGAIFELWHKDYLFRNAMVSLWRVVIGLMLASAAAIPLGMALGYRFTSLLHALNPLFRVLGQVNPFSLTPVFLMFFGIGEGAKLAIATWVCLWPLLHNTVLGVQTVDAVLIKTAHSMKTSPLDLAFKVLLPGAAPFLFTGLRIGVQICFFMMIAGEMLGATAGLGWLLHTYGHYFIAPKVYALGLCIVLLGVFVNQVLGFLEKSLSFWKESVETGGTAEISVRKAFRLGKRGAALVASLLAGLIFVGSLQVVEANRVSRNPMPHSTHEMHK